MLSVWIAGGYDQRYDLGRVIRGLALGSLLLAAIYGFLDESLRSSRALLALGAAWSVVALCGLRLLLHFAEFRNFRIGRERARNLVIVGGREESARAAALLRQTGMPKNLIGVVAPTEAEAADAACLSSLEQLDEVVRIYRVEEVLFCSRDVRAQEILAWMTRLGPSVSYKIVPEESLSIIGSNSKNEPGELYTIDIRYEIAQPGRRRNKRVFDLLYCAALLGTFPLWLFFAKKRKRLAQSWFAVLVGQKTWVGYAPHPENRHLPPLKPGVFTPSDSLSARVATPATVARLNFLYAKNWNVWTDVEILWKK
jgi:hypothetical protein